MAENRKNSSYSIGSFDSVLPNRKDSIISSVSSNASPSTFHRSIMESPKIEYKIEEEKEEEFVNITVINNKSQLDQYLKEVGEDDVSVLIVGAEWCQVCVHMMPNLDKLAGNIPAVKFLYVAETKVPSIKDDFSVTAFPTLFILRGQTVMEKIIGNQTQVLTKKLEFYTSFRKLSTESNCSTGSFTEANPNPTENENIDV